MLDPSLLFTPVIIEGVKDASLFPYSEVYVAAFRAFFAEVPPLLVAGAVLGAVIGGLTSWALGRLLAWLRERRPEFFSTTLYQAITFAVRKAGWILVALYTLPLGHLFPLLAGFFGARVWQVALAMAAGRLLKQFYAA